MRKLNTEEFLIKFDKKYPDRLGLDLTKFKYTTARTLSTVVCKSHNIEYEYTANNLLQGIKGCKLCKSEAISDAQNYNLGTFVKKSVQAHGNHYDYSCTVYRDIRTNVEIICKKHGLFTQNPQSHWNGYGCPQCGYRSLRKTKENFEAEATAIHGDRYNYEETKYQNNYTKVLIECREHGKFEISPKDHIIYQRGCPKCFVGNRSWAEISWLNSLNIPEEYRQKYIKINNKRVLVDALVENTVYEFWGDFWHGNPDKFDPVAKNTKCGKTFGELYKKTLEKRKLILDAGYSLIEIWESAFRQQEN